MVRAQWLLPLGRAPQVRAGSENCLFSSWYAISVFFLLCFWFLINLGFHFVFLIDLIEFFLVVAVSGHRNHQFACSVKFLCRKSVIPIKKKATVRRDTIARSEVAAVGPVDDSSSSASGSAEREINFFSLLSFAVFFLRFSYSCNQSEVAYLILRSLGIFF